MEIIKAPIYVKMTEGMLRLRLMCFRCLPLLKKWKSSGLATEYLALLRMNTCPPKTKFMLWQQKHLLTKMCCGVCITN